MLAIGVTAFSLLFSRSRATFISWLSLGLSLLVLFSGQPPTLLALSYTAAGLFLMAAPERRLYRLSTLIWIGLSLLGGLGVATIVEQYQQAWVMPALVAILTFWGAGLLYLRISREKGRSLTEPLLISVLVGGAFAVASLAWSPGAFSISGLLFLNLIFALPCLLSVAAHSFRLAYIDELTEIPGRRALVEALDDPGSIFTLAMLDVDHFKKFNDTHGHEVGDQVLRMVAARIATVGSGGAAFRYGGEEFTLFFPSKSLEQVVDELERLRALVEATPLYLRGEDRPKKKPQGPAQMGAKRRKASGKAMVKKPSVGVTVSIGVATSRPAETWQKVMKRADTALYKAKEGGRNQVSQAS